MDKKQPKRRTRNKFLLDKGESCIAQGNNELSITGEGVNTYLWIGGNGCYGTLSGMKTLETLAASIYRALGHQPAWSLPEKKKAKKVKRNG